MTTTHIKYIARKKDNMYRFLYNSGFITCNKQTFDRNVPVYGSIDDVYDALYAYAGDSERMDIMQTIMQVGHHDLEGYDNVKHWLVMRRETVRYIKEYDLFILTDNIAFHDAQEEIANIRKER